MTELELTEKTCKDRLREAEAMGRKLVDHVDLLQRLVLPDACYSCRTDRHSACALLAFSDRIHEQATLERERQQFRAAQESQAAAGALCWDLKRGKRACDDNGQVLISANWRCVCF